MSHRSEPNTNDRMLSRARKLRRDATIPERVLWSRLRDRRLGGLKFRRQVPIGPYVVDYLCESRKLVVELDGMSHVGRGKDDKQRTTFLESRGLRVLRVTNDDVVKSLNEVCELILKAALTPALSREERG